MSSFTDRINQSIKQAMLDRDKERLDTLRDIKSKLLLEATSGSGTEISDEVAAKICLRLHKQRKETYLLYKEQGRDDLAAVELAQGTIIEEFLPQMLSEDEIRKEVDSAILSLSASGMGDMGKVMGFLTKKLAGKADGKILSSIVRAQLSK
jgi:hypothetical protein